jgi:pseudouridine-5'-phosphate glycosidase/sugar/nucleoside kinase (ribokinase family)
MGLIAAVRTLPCCYSRQILASCRRRRCLSSAHRLPPHSSLQILPSIQDALANHRPVVALESTIVAHGMPYPQNYELSQRVASILRSYNVEPATIAVQNGIPKVGLTLDELHDLCRAGEQGRAVKCSTRELPLVMALHSNNGNSNNKTTSPITGLASSAIQWGATTVASTMHLAHLAGITTFCTGGIGGVHRGGELSMDVSADLSELARTPVIVVSAGIKSILDIARTLEVLETNKVLALAYQTDEYPAFFSARSGVRAPARVDSAEEVAAIYWGARDLCLPQGISLAVPNHDPAGAHVEDAIQAALQEAHAQGIAGQAVTPFILKRVAETTSGDSLRSNMALVEQNAHVSAKIAIAVCQQRRVGSKCTVVASKDYYQNNAANSDSPRSRVVVLGGCVLDLIAKPEPGRELLLYTSNPAVCLEADGGVGRNVAEVLGRLGESPILYSAVGADARGRGMLQRLEEDMGVQALQTVRVMEANNTATYVAAFDGKGDLHTAFADMSVLDHMQVPADDILGKADALVMDANPPMHVLKEAARRAHDMDLQVFFEPTSVPKAREAARDAHFMSFLTAAFPNAAELVAMAVVQNDDLANQLANVWVPELGMDALKEVAAFVLSTMNKERAYLVVTLGASGVLLATRESAHSTPTFRYFPGKQHVKVANSSGAGDSLCGAFIYAVLNGTTLDQAVEVGMQAAAMSLECANRTVSAILSPETLRYGRDQPSQ